MKKILFLTNMYPSQNNPSYGIFVEKTFIWLKNTKSYDIKLIKICKELNIIKKIVAYIFFYLKAIYFGVFCHYDCIYAHYISHCALPIKFIRFFNKKIIIVGNIHGEDVFSDDKKYQKNSKRAKIFLKNCDYIISPSLYFKNKLSEEYHFNIEKIFVSPSGGVDTNYFKPKDRIMCKKNIGLNIDKIHIGLVSRIEEGKGWDIFVNAADIINRNNVEFVIVGEGSQKEELKKIIEKKGLQKKVILLPMAGHDLLPDIYCSFDIFCFPTRRKAESLGLVGLEAMACGLPCIISNIEGPSSYCNNENCLRFNPLDMYDLSGKITELLDADIDYLNKMKKSAIKTSQQFDCSIVKREFLDFFDRIL